MSSRGEVAGKYDACMATAPLRCGYQGVVAPPAVNGQDPSELGSICNLIFL